MFSGRHNALAGEGWWTWPCRSDRTLLAVALFGGYLNRRNDGPSNYKAIWEDGTKLVAGTQTLRRTSENGEARTPHFLFVGWP